MQHKKRLTLFMPDLFSQLAKCTKKQADLPSLARILSKADTAILPTTASTALTFFAELSMPSNNDCPPPKAALHLYGEGKDLASWVCYSSPVFMQPNRDHMAMTQVEGFEFESHETDALCAELNDYFKEDGVSFFSDDRGFWFCSCNETHEITNKAPHEIAGENIMNFLPSGKTNMPWRKIFNESQMLLHHSATNQTRVSKGKPEINSLWFWGGGRLPAPFQSKFQQVFTNDLEIAGLTKRGKSSVSELPENLTPNLFTAKKDYLVYLSPKQRPLIEVYAQQCLSLLKNRTIDEVCIIPDYKQQFYLSAPRMRRFWKTNKHIEKFLT